MKSLNCMKIVPLLISIVSIGCAGTGGGRARGSMDSGWLL